MISDIAICCLPSTLMNVVDMTRRKARIVGYMISDVSKFEFEFRLRAGPTKHPSYRCSPITCLFIRPGW